MGVDSKRGRVSPLPRDRLRETEIAESRGRGGGGGTTGCRDLGCVSLAARHAKPGVRRFRRLPMRSKPALNPNNHAPAQIDVPRKHRSLSRLGPIGSTDEQPPGPGRSCAGAGRFGERPAVAAREDGGSAVLQVRPTATNRFARPTNNRRGQVVPVRELVGSGHARLWPHGKTAEAPYSRLSRRTSNASTEGLTSHARPAVAPHRRVTHTPAAHFSAPRTAPGG
jgi:hypothetical protein